MIQASRSYLLGFSRLGLGLGLGFGFGLGFGPQPLAAVVTAYEAKRKHPVWTVDRKDAAALHRQESESEWEGNGEIAREV